MQVACHLWGLTVSLIAAGCGSGVAKPESEEAQTINQSPSVSVALSPPSGATVATTLYCTAAVADPEGDPVSITWSWTVSDTPVAATATNGNETSLMSSFAAGDVVDCTASITDAVGGEATASASTTIANSPPTITDIVLSSATVYTDDVLLASATTSDADDDTLTLSIKWYVDGNLVQSGSEDTLDGSSTTAGFDKGQSVQVVVEVSDGMETVSESSETALVVNSLPSAPVVTIAPVEPVPGDDLICAVTTESTDADGDPVTYTMEWTVDALPHTATGTTHWADDTVSGADTAPNEIWSCTATPQDGTDTGTTASTEVEVLASCEFSLSLDGTDDFVTFGEPASLDFARSSSYSIELWVNVQSYPASAGQLYVYGDYEGGRDNQALGIYVSPSGLLILTNRGSSSNVSLVSSSTLSLDQWYHVHVQQESGVGTRLYLDGTLEASTSSTAGTLSFSAPQEWTLGGRYYSYTDSYFQHLDGYLAEFRVWSDIRTSAEILAAAAFEPIDPTSEPHLAGMWSLDEGSGSTVHDLSGVADDGTVMNGNTAGGTWAETCPGAP